jgi:hypothetical protein
MRATFPSTGRGRARLVRRQHRAKAGRRGRKFKNGEALWRGQTLAECADSVAKVLGLCLAACSGNSQSGWVIEINDIGVDATVTYRLALADNLKQVQDFLKENVVPPPWGLRIVLRFYFGDTMLRNQFTVEFLRTDGRLS